MYYEVKAYFDGAMKLYKFPRFFKIYIAYVRILKIHF